MKKYFSSTLTGGKWFALFLYFYVLLLVYAGMVFVMVRSNLRQFHPNLPVGSSWTQLIPLLVLFGIILIWVLFIPVIVILMMRKVVGSFSLDGVPFAFGGKPVRYLGMNIGYGLLTVLTAGIFFPWCQMILTRYLVRETSYRGNNLDFTGRGWTLFLIFLATVLVPILALIAVVFIVVMSLGEKAADHPAVSSLLTVFIYSILIPCAYKTAQWFVNGLRYGSLRARWDTDFWKSCFFILGQFFLTVITFGVYWPAALVRLYRYFTGRTQILDGDRVHSRAGFDGSVGQGFLLFWGQALLTLVTAGIYFPWAYAKCLKWLAAGTFTEQA